jgi:uncharacterized membrane protein
MEDEPSLSSAARKNIETISRVEKALLQRRSIIQRAGESVARFFGSLLFIAAHVLFFTCWIIINTGRYPRIAVFDPYPFSFLSLIVGIEFIFLTTFVLLNQKHEIRRNEQWAHLHLQLSMLTEQEVTKNMQMLSRLCERLGLHDAVRDKELSELAVPTSVTAFVGEIEKSRDAGASVSEVVREIAGNPAVDDR